MNACGALWRPTCRICFAIKTAFAGINAGALKCLDVFSVHGFPVGLMQCESNLLGIVDGAGTNVGSGGWVNVIAKFVKAKQFCDAPFEVVG